jgi:hypothetical protein
MSNRITLTDLLMTRSKRIKKKSIWVREEELAELCRKNNVGALFNEESLAPMSQDPSPSHVPTRVPTVIHSKLVDPQILWYGQTIPESSSCTHQHHLNVA